MAQPIASCLFCGQEGTREQLIIHFRKATMPSLPLIKGTGTFTIEDGEYLLAVIGDGFRADFDRYYAKPTPPPLRVCPNCGNDQYDCRSNGCNEGALSSNIDDLPLESNRD